MQTKHTTKTRYYIFVQAENSMLVTLGIVFANNHLEAIWEYKNHSISKDIEQTLSFGAWKGKMLIAAPFDAFLQEVPDKNIILPQPLKIVE